MKNKIQEIITTLDRQKGLYRVWIFVASLWSISILMETLSAEGVQGLFTWSFLYLGILPPYLLFAIMMKQSKKLTVLLVVLLICFPYLHYILKYGTLKESLIVIPSILILVVITYFIGR